MCSEESEPAHYTIHVATVSTPSCANGANKQCGPSGVYGHCYYIGQPALDRCGDMSTEGMGRVPSIRCPSHLYPKYGLDAEPVEPIDAGLDQERQSS